MESLWGRTLNRQDARAELCPGARVCFAGLQVLIPRPVAAFKNAI